MERRVIDLTTEGGRPLQVVLSDSKIFTNFISAELIIDGSSSGVAESPSPEGALISALPRSLHRRALDAFRQEVGE